MRWRFTFQLAIFTILIMVLLGYLVREQQGRAVEKEVKERGVALVTTLAANCLEPISLGTEQTLAIMLLVKDIVQAEQISGAEGASGFSTQSTAALVWENLKMLGHEAPSRDVRNEGVVFIKVAGRQGRIIASADASKAQEQWLEEVDRVYRPPAGSDFLRPGEGGRIWESPEMGGLYVIAAPITQVPADLAAAETAGGVSETAADGAYMGAVYLGMSKGIVRRALAHVAARLLLLAFGMLLLGMLGAVFIATLLVRPIHILNDAVAAVAAGNFNQRVKISRSDEIGELASDFNDMTRGLAERDLIRNAFGAYVSKDVLEDILVNPDAMNVGGARKNVTMLCSDVRGFTSMSEKLEPEQVVEIINLYLDAQSKVISGYKGYLDRFVGDAVRAVFGVPLEKPDDAERALRCACAIKEVIAGIVLEREAGGLISPRIGMGLDTGTVIAGNLGAKGAKLDYTVVGVPVGIAESLVDAARDPNARGAQIIVSEYTYSLVKDLFEFRELPPLEIEGRSRPLEIYELIRPMDGGKAPA